MRCRGPRPVGRTGRVLRHASLPGSFEEQYDEVTVKTVLAVVQILGFSNTICNPIVYAFMNESFRKNFLSAVCCCVWREAPSPGRRHGPSGTALRQRRTAPGRGEDAVEETKGEAFSHGHIEVKLCDLPEEPPQPR